MTQDRIEQAARECVREYGDCHPARLAAEFAALIRREREDAARVERERATASVEALHRFHLMRDLDSGCCHASMMGVTDDGPWIGREDALDALRARGPQ